MHETVFGLPYAEMRITSEIRDGIAILTLSGRLMFDESILALRNEVGRHLNQGIRRFAFDFSDVPHCDSSGCGEMIGAYTSITKAGGFVAIGGATERVQTLWKRIQLLQVFNLFPTLGEAENFLRRTL